MSYTPGKVLGGSPNIPTIIDQQSWPDLGPANILCRRCDPNLVKSLQTIVSKSTVSLKDRIKHKKSKVLES